VVVGRHLSTGKKGLTPFSSFVLGFGENAVVIEPESLRSEVAAELARIADGY
jgi:predicted DNA-binding transcriptional regulator YafY